MKHTISSDATAPVSHSMSQNSLAKPTSNQMTPISKSLKPSSKHYPPKMDLGQKEKSESMNGSDGTNHRHSRSHSFVKEVEPKNGSSTLESLVSNAIKDIPATLHRRNESLATISTSPVLPPLRAPASGPRTSGLSGHKHSHSLHNLDDFDPLKSTVPVISVPTSLSLENLPVKTSSTSEGSSLAHDLSNTYMSQNSLVLPLTIGMTSNAVSSSDTAVEQQQSPMIERQGFVANEYSVHQQQFMVVPQQQPFVFNQVGGMMQQQMVDTNTYPTQLRTTNGIPNHQQYSGQSLHQQQRQQYSQFQHHQSHHQQYQQHPTQQLHTNSPNPFDPFLS